MRLFNLKYSRIPSILECSLGEITTVKVTKRTRDRLAELGNKKETYEDVISKLIEFYEKNNKQLRGVRT